MGENQCRWRGDVQRGGGSEEDDGGDEDDGSTGKRETKRDWGNIGKQQQITGEVLH